MKVPRQLRGPFVHAALAPLALAVTLVPALTDKARKMPKPMPPFEEMARLRVVHVLPGMEAAAVQKNLVYKTAGEPEAPLHLDVYAPADLPAGEKRPAVIFVHGGPVPRAGIKEWGLFVSYGQLAAASGFVGITFHHRFFSPEMAQEADRDVADLVAYVRKNASDLGVDRDRIALWAFSGGGPFLARWLAEPPEYLRALVSYYAVLDIREAPPGQPGKLSSDVRARLSPVARLPLAVRPVPMLIARAGQDNAYLNGTVDAFVAEALRQNAPFELLNHSDGRHGFDILDDDARSREIVARTLAFLKTHLGPP
ncbi:MAG TPA: alpha/beta hydrolase [Vicinamibacteria bacterium]|nr:alpha/beta hydrolase [Vicinamibacteria bacterium]